MKFTRKNTGLPKMKKQKLSDKQIILQYLTKKYSSAAEARIYLASRGKMTFKQYKLFLGLS